MSGASTTADRRRLGHAWLRWTACLMLVMGLHATMLLTLRRTIRPLGAPVPESIMIDLAPEPAAPPEPSAPADPRPPQPQPPPQEPPPPEPPPPEPPPPEPPPPELPLPEPVPVPIP